MKHLHQQMALGFATILCGTGIVAIQQEAWVLTGICAAGLIYITFWGPWRD